MIVYQPDIVGVGRMFMVALDVPPQTPELRVTAPPCVEMFDRTPLPTEANTRKYYFRSVEPASRADIMFGHPAGEATVSVEIWSFEDLRQFRELKGVQLPRRWPLGEALPELKQAPTITTDDQREAARGQQHRGEQWLALTDEAIWSLQPDTTIPRWHWVNIQHGCPIHGREVYRHTTFYPWLHEDGRPIRTYDFPAWPYTWKTMCPEGKELLPSNDFGSGDMTSGEFPDDGIGGGCDHDGVKYGFIAEICQAYCHKMLNAAPQCAEAYLSTGDVRYVHKALVAMSRLAVEWSYLATMTQHRHRNSRSQVERRGPAPFSEGPCLEGSGFTVYCIDQPTYQAQHAEAYDRIFPAIEQDEDIVPFLRSKGFDVSTHEDVRRFLEENLFAVWMQGSMDWATASNEPYPQWGMARLAEALNYGRGDEFLDWLYDGAGKMRFFVTNTFFRDGAPYESTGGYNGMHLTAIGPIIESIEHLRRMRPDVYPEDKYPNLSKSRRYHNVFDFSMNTVNIDRTFPRVGDTGSHPKYEKPSTCTWQNGGPKAFEHAYRLFRDPKFAWALANARDWEPSPEFPYTREEIESEATKWLDDWNDRSCLQDGYGLAMLRSGRGESKRSLWMMYGHARSHTHDDIMHIGLDAHQSEILGHLGYPRNWNHWYANWITQILARSIPFVDMAATAQIFADAGPVHVCEAFAQGFRDKLGEDEGYEILDGERQRRMLAIVDVSDDQFYCLDLYRIMGGHEHWWTFHAQEGELSTAGLDLRKQEGGTLAGPDVPYGDDEWLKNAGCAHSGYGWGGKMFGFAHLYNVERANPEGAWSVDWALKDADGLRLRLTVPDADGAEVVLCDGKSPAGASPYEMKWLLLHKAGQTPVRTQVPGVMELYRDQPLIKQVRPLEVSGSDGDGFQAFGCVVELANGRTDTIFASADAEVVRSAPGGFEFAGRFGLYSEENGVPAQAVLVGGTRLTKNGVGITCDSGEYRAEIVAADRDAETITVSPPPADIDCLAGNYVFITNPVRRTAHKVVKVELVPAGARLHLESDSRIGTGQVTGHRDQAVETSTPFRLSGYRYYHGARLLNADRTAEYRLAGVRDRALIDAHAHPAVSAQTLEGEFPVGTWFDVYDYGVGDTIVWPRAVSATLSVV